MTENISWLADDAARLREVVAALERFDRRGGGGWTVVTSMVLDDGQQSDATWNISQEPSE